MLAPYSQINTIKPGDLMIAAYRMLHRSHAPLAAMTAVMLALAAVSASALVLGDEVLAGQPIWAKPLKFSISFAAYGATLALLVGLLTRGRRVAWWAGSVLAVASVLEMVAIVGQVLRGRASHFNQQTPLDGAIYSAMGGLVAVIYLSTLVVGVLLLRAPVQDAALAWALRLGVVIAVLGLSVGFLMLMPTPEQAAALAAGAQVDAVGAHAVGVTDGGAGLPFVGWSTTGGDLRVGHFLGMHALQVLPLLALGLGSRGGSLDALTRLRIVQLAAAAYTGGVALTVWQALRGQPLTGPDSATLTAAAALLALTALGAAAIARTSGRQLAAS